MFQGVHTLSIFLKDPSLLHTPIFDPPIFAPSARLHCKETAIHGSHHTLGGMTWDVLFFCVAGWAPDPASWWFQPTHLKNMLVKLGSSSPIFGVKIKNICKPPTSQL